MLYTVYVLSLLPCTYRANSAILLSSLLNK